MANTQFNVLNTATSASASDNNAGCGQQGDAGAAIHTNSNCETVDEGAGFWYIINSSATGWGATTPGDWVNVEGALLRVDNIAVGGDANKIYGLNVDGTMSEDANLLALVGGAWATIQQALDTITSDHVNLASDWPLIQIGAGTWQPGASLQPATVATASVPILVKGTWAGNALATIIDANDGAYDILNADKAGWHYHAMDLRNTLTSGGHSGILAVGAANVFHRMRISDVSGYGIRMVTGCGQTAIGCEVSNWAQASAAYGGFYILSTMGSVHSCIAHSPGYATAKGISIVTAGAGPVTNSIADGCGGGFYVASDVDDYQFYLMNPIARNCGIAVEVNTSSKARPGIIQNLISSGCPTVFDGNAGMTMVQIIGGLLHDYTTKYEAGKFLAVELEAPIDIATDPFVDGANLDFRLKPGLIGNNGEQVLAAAYPKQFLVNGQLSSWQSYSDPGAVQRAGHIRRP